MPTFVRGYSRRWVVKAANGEMAFGENGDGNEVTLTFDTADAR